MTGEHSRLFSLCCVTMLRNLTRTLAPWAAPIREVRTVPVSFFQSFQHTDSSLLFSRLHTSGSETEVGGVDQFTKKMQGKTEQQLLELIKAKNAAQQAQEADEEEDDLVNVGSVSRPCGLTHTMHLAMCM